jgi:peptidoglycan/LPS O-acetylase OafA/YrhL
MPSATVSPIRKISPLPKSSPAWIRQGKIPCLNGLRAFAILAVIASHYNRRFEGSWAIGHFGVTSFFVISGFLITLLLIRERNQTGRVSLKEFYIRRALRILPAYLTFLLVMFLLQITGVSRIRRAS